jgi:hypothetical protein
MGFLFDDIPESEKFNSIFEKCKYETKMGESTSSAPPRYYSNPECFSSDEEEKEEKKEEEEEKKKKNLKKRNHHLLMRELYLIHILHLNYINMKVNIVKIQRKK